jgi:type IV secretion system protein VirB10
VAAAEAGDRPARKPGALEEKLEAVELRAASAGVLPDRDRLITQGAVLDCVLETKIVSTVAGMTACHLTRDVYSTSGRVVLLDRGSRVVGRYQGGLQQGDVRIFVVWTRVETPAGVVVELDSPGTGPLGEAGLGGHADTHFWDRFGAAILLSVIEDGVDAAATRASGTTSNTTINVANTANAGKDVIARSMEPTINIPPTLVKNQGERVGIFVARDLDFRGVYGLERTRRGLE